MDPGRGCITFLMAVVVVVVVHCVCHVEVYLCLHHSFLYELKCVRLG